MALERQTSALPPAQPSYILRGHTSQIHSVRFVRQNSRLLTGDAEGWIVYWKLETKRPLAVWKAHDGAILGTEEWGLDRLITHGRDNSLRIWQLRASDEPTLSTILPAEDATTPRLKPWLLYTLPVNTLNFCAFSLCYEHKFSSTELLNDESSADQGTIVKKDPILIATPATDDKKINVYQFPKEKLRYVVPRISTTDSGMVMAVKLVYHPTSKTTLILSGYEGGLTAVHQLSPGSSSSVISAELVYVSQPHTQPILSLDVSSDGRTYYTSSADAVIAEYRIPELLSDADHSDSHAQEGPPTTFDNEVLSTPGVAAEERSTSNHVVATSAQPTERLEECTEAATDIKESSSSPKTSSLSFSKQHIQSAQPSAPKPASLSSLLSAAPHQSKLKPPTPIPPPTTIQIPHKTANTKHSGQQSLRVRSDGRIFATGGWDTRIRIYSTKTLKEVAVLRWHKEGVYAVDFAQILDAGDLVRDVEIDDGEVVKMKTGLGKLQRQREEQMQLKHWIVAGAKDGKVSLWEVF